MNHFKPNWIILLTLTTLLFVTGLGPSYGGESKVAQVIYITEVPPCAECAQTTVPEDALVKRTFTGPRKALLKTINYPTEVPAAERYIGKYDVVPLPVIIFLDNQNNKLWSARAEVPKADIAAKLSQFGG